MSDPTTAGRSVAGIERQSLLRYYRILQEHRWLIAACTALVLAAALVYVEAAPRRYQAQSELLVQAASPSNAELSALPVIHQTGDPTEDVLTGASLVTTPQVAAAVVRELHLKTTPAALLGDVQANPIGQTGIVAIQAQASSASLAERLANAFAAQTLVNSTATMHASLATLVPALRARVAAIPPALRNGPGSLGDELAQLELLQQENDPTLQTRATADLPSAPYTPRTKLALAAGLIGGLLLGVAAAFAFHALDPRLRRGEQLSDLFGLPILARIPREHFRRRTMRPLLPTELSFVSHEGYRRLRTGLAMRAHGESRAILITGSMPSEGKTTTAINLAVALAQGGGRVILIEADLRRPTFASTLDLDLVYGTEHVLIGEAELAEALVPVSVDKAPLDVLAAKGAGVEFADRLSFAVARMLVHKAKMLADFVVIDSPPLTAVIDALPLAQLADDVLIVARLGRSKLSKLTELDELLIQHAAPVVGFVLVGDAPSRGRSRDNYYSNYSSGDGFDPRERSQSVPAEEPERSTSEPEPLKLRALTRRADET